MQGDAVIGKNKQQRLLSQILVLELISLKSSRTDVETFQLFQVIFFEPELVAIKVYSCHTEASL